MLHTYICSSVARAFVTPGLAYMVQGVYSYIYVLVKSESWSKLRAILTFDRSKVRARNLTFDQLSLLTVTYTYYGGGGQERVPIMGAVEGSP